MSKSATKIRNVYEPAKSKKTDSRRTEGVKSNIPVACNEKSALVISGGGAKGAFAVGIVADLYDRFGRDGWFSIVGGASTGAILAPLAALLGAEPEIAEEVLETMVQSYSTMKTSDLLDRRGWLGLVMRRDALNESSPLRSLLYERFRPEWFDWLQNPSAPECYVLYTNFRTGQKVAASPKDHGMTRDLFIDAIVASASVPGLMDATMIDGDACFDGCLRDLVPVERAVELGATIVAPIVLDPEVFQNQSDGLNRVDRILSRAFSILVDEVGRSDLEIARNQSQGVQIRETLVDLERNLSTVWQSKPIRQARHTINSLVHRSDMDELLGGQGRLHRVIEGLRPDYQLTDDWLRFQPEEMKGWLAHGREVSRAVMSEPPFSCVPNAR